MTTTITQTPQQKEFCNEVLNSSSNLLLKAVAGSGKTTTMIQAISQLPVGSGVLACAFNKKIATELEQKLPGWVTSATLNALGHRLWAKHTGKKLKLNGRKMGKIASQVCNDANAPELWKPVKDLASKAKINGIIPLGVSSDFAQGLIPDTHAEWENIATFFNINLEGASVLIIEMARACLDASIRAALEGEIDFDDQLYMAGLFSTTPPTTFNYIFIDEAQDLSILQHKLLAKFLRPTGRLIAIGDPSQAIYGFRGAATNSIDILAEEYDMKPLSLTVNFRCGTEIIQAAQRLVPEITAWDGAPVGIVISARNCWKSDLLTEANPDFVILCRNIFPLIKLGFALIKQGIGVNMIDRDLGATLKNIAEKLEGETQKELLSSLSNWRLIETKRAEKQKALSKLDWIEDNADSLKEIIYNVKARSSQQLISGLKELFESSIGNVKLTTIHRSKGQEWDTVFFLDSFRVPSKYAREAVENDPEGCAWMLEQEQNLEYIAITRAKNNLTYIDMGDFRT